MLCRNCGDVVDPRREELGYDYCLKEECQRRCVKRVHLAAVGVNKAADYYMKAEEVLPPRPPATATATTPPEEVDVGVDVDANGPAGTGRAQPKPVANTVKRPQTTLERLQKQERALDEALDRSYERFRRGDITATEMHAERDRLVGTYNRQVMSENIRYRSMLRGPANRAG